MISSAGTIGHAQRKKMKPDPRFMSPICRSILNGYRNVKSKIIKLQEERAWKSRAMIIRVREDFKKASYI